MVAGGNRRDQAMLLAYDINHHLAKYELTGQFRETGTDILRLPTTKSRVYHIYLAFSASDRSSQSDSIYLGSIDTGE